MRKLFALGALALAACSGGSPAGSSSGSSGTTLGTSGGNGGTSSGNTTGSGTSGGTTSSGNTGGTSGTFSPVVGDCDPDGWCWMNPLPQGNSITALAGSSDSDVWAFGQAGTLRHFDGTKWSTWSSPVRDTFTSAAARSATDVWAIAGPGTLHWDGSSWHVLDGGYSNAIAFAGDVLVGTNGLELQVWDGGWVSTYDTQYNILRSLAAFPDGQLFASGEGLWHLDRDGGFGLIPPTVSTDEYLGGLAGRSSSDVYFAGPDFGGAPLYHWDGQALTAFPWDGGSYWSVGIMAGTPNDVAMYTYTGSGPSLTHLFPDGGTSDQGLVFAGPQVLWGPSSGSVDWEAGGLGQIARLDGLPGSIGATSAFTGGISQSPWVPRRDLAFIAGPFGFVKFDGNSWTQSTQPQATLVAGTTDQDGLALGYQSAYRWTGSSWSPIAKPADVYAGMLLTAVSPGHYVLVGYDSSQALVVEEFDGQTWSQLPAPGFYPTSVAGNGPGDVWLGGYSQDGGSYLAHYDGTSWTPSTLPGATYNQVVSLSAAGGAVWAVAPGSVARLDNGTWTSMSAELPDSGPYSSVPAFIRSVHVRAPDDVWLGFGGLPAVWHWNGQQFEQMELPGAPSTVDFGTPPTGEVFLFGSGGEILIHG